MMSSNADDVVLRCLNWWLAALQTLDDFGEGKARLCHDEEDLKALFAMARQVNPFVGVMYENTLGLAQPISGVGAQLSISLALCFKAEPAGQDRPIPFITNILNQVRQLGLDETSPTGHRWHFAAEVPLGVKDGLAVWAQRWTAPVVLARARKQPLVKGLPLR